MTVKFYCDVPPPNSGGGYCEEIDVEDFGFTPAEWIELTEREKRDILWEWAIQKLTIDMEEE